MKKLFSSKSGFSLIEIVVAFAVFAVMAAMVSSIMSLALYQRNENLKFADDVEAQKDDYARIEKDLNYGGSSDGKISLNFGDSKEYELDYSSKSMPSGDIGINYFVGNANYKKNKPSTPSGDPDDGTPTDSNTLISQLDSYIYGSPYFESIRMDRFSPASAAEIAKAQSDGVVIPAGMTLYIMHITPNDDQRALINRDLIVWRNFSVRMPDNIGIYDCGYIQKSLGEYTKKFVASQNLYEITKVTNYSVNISIPTTYMEKYFNNGYAGKSNDEIYHFSVGKGIEQYYFILNTTNTTLTNKSFGDKADYDDGEGGMPYYRPIEKKDKDGNVIMGSDGKAVTHPNIYAAKDNDDEET